MCYSTYKVSSDAVAIAQLRNHYLCILHTQVASEDMPTSNFSNEVDWW